MDSSDVVAEIPVYLSKSLSENLYLFQYPLRPASSSYDGANIIQARVKPVLGSVELDVGIETRSKNYDRSKGEQMALNVDGMNAAANDPDSFFRSKVMDKQVLSSSCAASDCSRYAVGYFQDGELHLNLLKKVLHMRPTFGYLDKSDKKQKDELGADSGQKEEEGLEQVRVQFARQTTERSIKAQETSFKYWRKKNEDERWIPANFHPITSEFSEKYRMQLLCSSVDREISTLNISSGDYLSSLSAIGEDDKTDLNEAQLPSTVSTSFSLSMLRTLPLLDQIKRLMISAKLFQFNTLTSLLLPEHAQDKANVLKCLQQVAVMVQGCWVVKSELLYPKDTFSHLSGIPSESMCKARDYVLLQFHQRRIVDRRGITTALKLPPEDVKDILDQVSLLKYEGPGKGRGKGWEFLLETDSEFPKRYPEVAQRQQMFWDSKKAQYLKQEPREGSEAGSPTRPRRRRTRSQVMSGGSESESGGELGTDKVDAAKKR